MKVPLDPNPCRKTKWSIAAQKGIRNKFTTSYVPSWCYLSKKYVPFILLLVFEAVTPSNFYILTQKNDKFLPATTVLQTLHRLWFSRRLYHVCSVCSRFTIISIFRNFPSIFSTKLRFCHFKKSHGVRKCPPQIYIKVP